MIKQLLFVFTLLASLSLFGQDPVADEPILEADPFTADTPPESPYPWEFGIKVGTASMGGDMIEPDLVIFTEARLGAGIFLRKTLSRSFALRLAMMYGELYSNDAEAEDESRRNRGFRSEATVIEPSLVLEWEPFGKSRFRDDYTFRPGFNPYVSAGIGYGIWGDVETFYNEDFGGNGDLRDRIAQDKIDEEDDTGGIVFPLGAGVRYQFSPRSSLGLDYNFRVTSNDLIDGVATSGDPDDDDTYAFFGLTYSVGFGARDADRDGIKDIDDECPSQPGPEATNGCPDTDGDGVADKDDECPTEPGPAATNGCPDGDGDGVADKDDECPTEPGTAATNGCPDGDGDGVADKDDECPDEAGLPELNGCPDGDGDGIADKDDECPAEPGPAATNGCPDADGDGIADKDDECPDEAGVAEYNGCPGPRERPENRAERIRRYSELIAGQDFQYIRVDSINGTIEIDRLYFPTDRSSLNRPDRLIIEEIDRFLALPGAEDFNIRFEGHADYRYTDEYNMDLSQRRAQSASDYAEREGAREGSLSTIGFGENQPVGETLRENRVVIPVAFEPTRMIRNN